ncbi:cytochrome P450 [Nocardia sp. NPDC050697]|uniref:cytochrome P450 n=1 Tax=Nocardia sp. NPDC050697 TaxID=3155158 RepID=UPI0033EF2507
MSDTLTDPPHTGLGEPPHYPMVRDSGCPLAPPAQLRVLGESKPVHRVRIWDGSTPWLVTGYDEVKALFADPRVSVDDRMPGFPHWNGAMKAMVAKRVRSVVIADGDEHAKFRRVMSKHFTFHRMSALRPKIQAITDAHIDAMLAGPAPADLVALLGLPVPSLVISELLGVPYEDAPLFQKHADIGLARFAAAEDARQGRAELLKYLARLVETKMENPGEDAVSDLAEKVKTGDLTVLEAAQAANGLLLAGHETTANMIGLSVLTLLEHPDQLALLRDTDDPKVLANGVEELLRYLSIVQNGQRRVATDDIEIGGETIRAGEGIIIDLVPANWDGAVFDDPLRFDVERDNAGRNVAFGFGRHSCVGQTLGRIELQIVLGTLFRRVPTLRLATPIEQIQFKNDRLAYGVYELPVSW